MRPGRLGQPPAGDQPAEEAGAFEQQRLCALARGADRGDDAGRARAGDDDVVGAEEVH